MNDPDLLDPSSVTMPRPSALFCLSKAFKSRTLGGKWISVQILPAIFSVPHRCGNRECCSAAASAASLPAGHHQPRQTFEKPHVSFFLQVVQHFLQQSKSSQEQTKAVTCMKAARSEMYLLDQDVPPVQDRDAQLEGDGDHGTETAWEGPDHTDHRSVRTT